MEDVTTDRLRNVALVGHNGSGKTTLAEALLVTAGALPRAGRVEDGTTVCDTEPEEQRHHQSLSLALAPFDWKGHRINLIDTPGFADFEGEVAAALAVADLAVFVVSAVDGVEAQTERIWRLAEARGLPRMIFVNKLDRERASFERTLEELRERFGAGIAPLELPIGEEAGFRGVADLLSDQAIVYADGTPEITAIPDDMATREHEVHDNLVEGIVVGDDAQLERYLEGDIPSVEELERTMAVGVDAAKVFPVVCGSASRRIAVDRLADFVVEIGPSPLDVPAPAVVAGDTEVTVQPERTADALAVVFKTVNDPFVGHLSLFKVLSGTIRADDHLVNSRTGADERLHGLFRLRGREQLATREIAAGDIGAVAKLAGTRTGDTLAAKGRPVHVPLPAAPTPVFSLAVAARSQSDEDKLANALHRLVEEDPALRVERDDETRQTLLRGQGETHVQVAIERLQRQAGIEVDTAAPLVPYRETVTATADAEGRYKKQSGGHGQYGVCSLRVEPLERGAGFEFVDAVVGGAIPRQFIPAVEKGVLEAMAEGGAFGFPVVDVRVTCYDGKAHAVDSSEMSFKMAARLGFREAVAAAGPVALEPVSHVEVTVPSEHQGEVMGDLNARRARVQGTAPAGDGEHVVSALVPTAELARYAVDLRSLTGGRGRFTAEHDHYDVVPTAVADRLTRPGG